MGVCIGQNDGLAKVQVGVLGQAALLQAAVVISISWLLPCLKSLASSPFSQQEKNGVLRV